MQRERLIAAAHYETDEQFRTAVREALVEVEALGDWLGGTVAMQPLRIRDDRVANDRAPGAFYTAAWIIKFDTAAVAVDPRVLAALLGQAVEPEPVEPEPLAEPEAENGAEPVEAPEAEPAVAAE